MPRRARIRHAGVPQNLIQRGNNRAACFFADVDYRFYLDTLKEGATRYSCSIAIRETVNSGTALGSEWFKDEIEAALARSVRLGTPRRPRKI